MIDNLRYFYDPANPNRLMKVTDLTNSHAGFHDDDNGTLAGDPDDDYAYDQDANITADQNKEISYIAYNHYEWNNEHRSAEVSRLIIRLTSPPFEHQGQYKGFRPGL